MNITSKTKQVLEILSKNGEVDAETFAKEMCPRSDYWHNLARP